MCYICLLDSLFCAGYAGRNLRENIRVNYPFYLLFEKGIFGILKLDLNIPHKKYLVHQLD